MKKKIAIILLLIGSLSLVGCQSNSNKEEKSNKNKRFKILCDECINLDIELIRVQDKETGEEFIIYEGIKQGGITKADKSNK